MKSFSYHPKALHCVVRNGSSLISQLQDLQTAPVLQIPPSSPQSLQLKKYIHRHHLLLKLQSSQSAKLLPCQMCSVLQSLPSLFHVSTSPLFHHHSLL